MKSYIIESDLWVNRLQEEVNQEYMKWEKKTKNNPDIPDAFEVYESEILLYSSFSSHLYNSMFVMVNSLLEDRLFDICDECKDLLNLKLKREDLKGRDDIKKSKDYLKKVIGVGFSKSLTEKWNTASKYKRIRNSIVHKGGKIIDPKSKDEKVLIDFIQARPEIKFLEESKTISIQGSKFILKFCDFVDFFLQDLVDEIRMEIERKEI